MPTKRSPSPSPERTPKEVLFSYFAAMVELNRVCMAEDKAAKEAGQHLPNLAPLRKLHAEIREAHLTSRRRVAVLGWGSGIHDLHDPKNLSVKRIVEESKSRVAIDIFNKKDKDTVRYHLVLHKNVWRIDSVKERRGAKWVSLSL